MEKNRDFFKDYTSLRTEQEESRGDLSLTEENCDPGKSLPPSLHLCILNPALTSSPTLQGWLSNI